MIEAIQNHDYVLKKMYSAMALKLYGKPLIRLNNHEIQEVRIQVAAKIKNNKKKQEEESNIPFYFEDPDLPVLKNGWESEESKKAKDFFKYQRKKYTYLVMTTQRGVSIVKQQEKWKLKTN